MTALHVELISAPNIVNNGSSENSLTIGVSNPQLEGDFIFETGDEMHFWFIISDRPSNRPPDRPWGLTSKDFLFDEKVSKKIDQGDWTVTNEESISQYTAYRPDLKGYKAVLNSGSVTLQPGNHLFFTIAGLKSGLPDGYTSPQLAFITKKYPRLTGSNWLMYGPILKSPMASNNQRVGIGTDHPNVNFQVIGGGATDMVLETNGGVNSWAQYHLKTQTSEWGIGTSNDYMNNMLYISGQNIDPKTDKRTDGKNPFCIYPNGNASIGVNAINDFRLNLMQSDSYTAKGGWNINGLKIAPALPLNGNKLTAYNLIKFGDDGNYSFQHLPSGHHKKPTLSLTGNNNTALAFNNGSYTQFEVDSQTGHTYINGQLEVPQGIDGNLKIYNKNVLEFGAGEQKQGDAGKIGYQTWSDGLDIIGAGTDGNNRKITLFSEGGLDIRGPIKCSGNPGIISKTFTFNIHQGVANFYKKGNDNHDVAYTYFSTGISEKDYTGVVAGFAITNWDVYEDDKTHAIVRIIKWPANFSNWNDGNLCINIELGDQQYNNQPYTAITIEALFFHNTLITKQ